MFPHRQTISTVYLVAGLFFGFIVIRDFDSILAAQRAFFNLGPASYADAAAIAIAAAPLGLLATALMIHRNASRWLVAIPAIYGTLLTIGYATIALAVYLAWYLAVGYRLAPVPDAET